MDLGTGTGSNVRYVTARVPWAREWTVVDHDAQLLERVAPPSPACTIRRVHGDLEEEGLEEIRDCHVVTASALLDLVSERWLRALRDRCVEAGAGVYLTLTYDGSVRWEDGSAAAPGTSAEGTEARTLDALVLDAVNEHQRSDKGLGTALGPTAPARAEALFAEAGWTVGVEPSPWVLAGVADAPLVTRLVEGWVTAAEEVRPEDGRRIRAWAKRRIRDVATGAVTLRVGHLDLLALPTAPPATDARP